MTLRANAPDAAIATAQTLRREIRFIPLLLVGDRLCRLGVTVVREGGSIQKKGRRPSRIDALFRGRTAGSSDPAFTDVGPGLQTRPGDGGSQDPPLRTIG